MVSVPSLTSSMPDSVVELVSSLAHPAAPRARARMLIPDAIARVFMPVTVTPSGRHNTPPRAKPDNFASQS